MGRSRSRSPREWRHRNQCTECRKEFSTNANLRRHIEEQHRRSKDKINCPYCSMTFVRKHDLDRHWQFAHGENLKANQPVETPKEPEVPQTPGRNLMDDMVSLEPGSVERRIVDDYHSPPPVRREVVRPSPPTGLSIISLANRPPKETKDASVQTDPTKNQRMVERTIKEILDGDGKVALRLVQERFLTTT